MCLKWLLALLIEKSPFLERVTLDARDLLGMWMTSTLTDKFIITCVTQIYHICHIITTNTTHGVLYPPP